MRLARWHTELFAAPFPSLQLFYNPLSSSSSIIYMIKDYDLCPVPTCEQQHL